MLLYIYYLILFYTVSYKELHGICTEDIWRILSNAVVNGDTKEALRVQYNNN